MIDIHCHILPGLDDGPANIDFSIAMARAAVEDGTQIIVATPHVRRDHNVDPAEIAPAVDALNARLESEKVPLRVVAGAEVGWREAANMTADELRAVTLGSSDYLLLECPYGKGTVDLEGVIDCVRAAGLRPVLAHPERCPLFRNDLDRLASMVASGAVTSVTAGSLAGSFGESVQELAFEMLERGLVHDVASDAHDHLHRPPRINVAVREAELTLPGLGEHAPWFTVTAPMAILRGEPVGEPPRVSRPRRTAWRRVLRRN